MQLKKDKSKKGNTKERLKKCDGLPAEGYEGAGQGHIFPWHHVRWWLTRSLSERERFLFLWRQKGREWNMRKKKTHTHIVYNKPIKKRDWNRLRSKTYTSYSAYSMPPSTPGRRCFRFRDTGLSDWRVLTALTMVYTQSGCGCRLHQVHEGMKHIRTESMSDKTERDKNIQKEKQKCLA